MPSRRARPPLLATLVVATAFLGGACAHRLPPPVEAAPAVDLREAYAQAVEDARVAEPSEVVRTLRAVTASEPGLVWEGTPGASRVKVATWTDRPYYDASVGQDYALPPDARVWVSLVPDVAKRCRGYPRDPELLGLRLRQLLGLPPDAAKDRFVELWAEPADLYRPCPDPEIGDHECGLDFPASRYLTLSDDYRRWFDAQRAGSYPPAGEYPWTRLGYTYDWGGASEVGVSELIVVGGATVGVVAVTPTADYCD